MKEKFYCLHNTGYGLTVTCVGEFEDCVQADTASKIKGIINPLWCVDEEDLRGLLGSIQNALKNNCRNNLTK